jgi:hypothetical protein
VKTYEEAQEQVGVVQQLKAENAALQKESKAIPALKAEVADLRRQVPSTLPSQILPFFERRYVCQAIKRMRFNSRYLLKAGFLVPLSFAG